MWNRILISLMLIYGGTQLLAITGEELQLPSDKYWGPGEPGNVNESICPFKIHVPKKVIRDLKARLERTHTLRKPLEGGVGWTYGVDSDYLQTVLEYWRTKYNWTERQTLLNRYPQFKTNIQGLNIHFYHVKPNLPKNHSVTVLPLLLVHGWPGSVVEFQKIIPLLTTPRPDVDFVFEVIAPSLPGFGFSDGAVRPGLDASQVSVVMKNLMDRLGFKKFYTQGGDWGSTITSNMAALYPSSILGTHLNLCDHWATASTRRAIVWAFIRTLVIRGQNTSTVPSTNWTYLIEETGYMHQQATKPDTLGIVLADSPAGLAAYILERFSTATNYAYKYSQDGSLLKKFTIDELLDNLMVYWVTNSITTSLRLYTETRNATNAFKINDATIYTPTACAVFPHEPLNQEESVVRTRYANLIQMNHLPRGGHFAALEEPQLLADDVWSFVTNVTKSG